MNSRPFIVALSLFVAIAPSGCVAEGSGDFVDEDEGEEANVSSTSEALLIDNSRLFVWQTYYDVLNREPDVAGYWFWLDALNACNGDSACITGTRAQVALTILQSPENITQDPDLNPALAGYNSAFVTHCYTNFLQRQPDTAGKAYWLNVVNSTGDYSAVVSGFITSSEYRARFPM